MFIKILKSKIQQLTVSQSELTYPGSISLPKELMLAANIKPFESVHVNNRSNGNRIVTYAVQNNSANKITINGAASKLFKVGDEIHVLSFIYINSDENYTPLLIITDKTNNLIESKLYSINYDE